ncbi:DUF1501 domain-containing protein [bacterium]|nr:DUF1501 domain-containing protein [bacterium]
MSTPRLLHPVTRRTALKRLLFGAAGVALIDRIVPLARAAESAGTAAGPAQPVRPACAPARAKAVIQIWMWGGPAHLDTFDPKPDAGNDYCGPLKKPIATNVDGIRICELLPELAKHADKYSILRGMTHGNNGHETASYIVQTGHEPGGSLVYPCVGAVVSLFNGYDAGYKGRVPPYIVLTSAQGRFSEAGFLGLRYKPFVTGGDPAQRQFAVEGIVAAGITHERQQGRRALLHSLDTLGRAMPPNQQFQQLDRCEEKAYDMILGDGGKVFDLSDEKDALRDRYGRNTFGQSCLVARRLVESGVPCVTINYRGWDTHKQHFETMQRKLPEMDKGMASLLQDLADRGLLDSTIVWWSGEFGRTPRVQWESPWNGGRGHYGKCFSAVLAGGGFKGGCVVGASDSKGEEVADRPVFPQDMIASIYGLLGINPDAPLPNPRGLDVKVLQPEDTHSSRAMLREIM